MQKLFTLLVVLAVVGLMLTGSFPLLAQNSQKSPVMVGVASQNGFIIAHTNSIRHLATSHPGGAEVNVQWQTTGTKQWHQFYKYPKLGLSFIWYDYHNPVLGHSFAISPYINKTFYRSSKAELNFRVGSGIAIFSNKYDLKDNHKNSIISSSVNAVIQGRLEYIRMVSDHVGIMGALALNHYSNGATSKPNMGINIPTLCLGVNYYTSRPEQFQVLEPEPFDNSLFYNISTSVGIKQLGPSVDKKFWVNNISAAVGKQVNHKSNLLVGVEGFYDRSLNENQKTDTSLVNKPFPDTKRAGVFVGHELLFGKIALETHLGVYIYRPYKVDTFYYERVGLKYHINPTLYTCLDLKVHRGSADVIEMRVGARL